jgi:chaperone modulatory protein CbpM
MATDSEDAVWLHAQRTVTIVELAEACGLTVASVEELVEYGALAPVDPAAQTFTAAYVSTLREAARLCADLELEMPSMALVLRFLGRIHELEAEVRHLKAQLPR